MGVGKLSSSSTTKGSCLLDFQVGVRIRAVLACEVEDSARRFLRMGGGLDEPLRRPFSSSIDGGWGESTTARSSCRTTALPLSSPGPGCGGSSSLVSGERFDGAEREARSSLLMFRDAVMSLLVRGDAVGVVRMMLPSDIRLKISATWLPRMLSRICPLLHIRQKKFSSLRPTSLARRFRLVVYTKK